MRTSYENPATDPQYSRNGNYGTRNGANYGADGRRANKRYKAGEIDYSRLFQAMRVARRILEVYRTERMSAVRQYVGRHYSEGGTDQKVPINLLSRYISVMSRALIPQCPRVMLATQIRDSQPAVNAMQEWINQRLIESGFDEELHRWVIDAMFSVGVMKVALGTPGDAATSGYTAQAGVPFATCVDLDDFVYDVGANNFKHVSFIGHRYRMPLEVAMSLDYFDKDVRNDLASAVQPDDYRINQEGDDRIGIVGQGWIGGEQRDYEPNIDLWEIYLPRTKRVLTFAADSGGVPVNDGKPLRNIEWLGPPCGPYHFLCFKTVPGNAMPGSPVQDIVDLHEAVNNIYRKNINQTQRQKEVLPVRGGQVDDAKNLVQASDGEAFAVDNADDIKPVSYGGPNAQIMQYGMHLEAMFNKQAGNLDLISGAAPQSKTAAQDKLLNANASGGVQELQETTTKGTASVLKAYCWYWWYHPTEVMKTRRSLPGLADISLTRELHPGNNPDPNALKREGSFEDLNIRVDPYSMVFRSPQDRLQFLMNLWDKFSPQMQLLATQGVRMDVQYLLKKIAEYADEPDVINFFTIADPTPPMSMGPQGDPGGKPANTSREYIRRSQGQDTVANQRNDMANAARQSGANNAQEP